MSLEFRDADELFPPLGKGEFIERKKVLEALEPLLCTKERCMENRISCSAACCNWKIVAYTIKDMSGEDIQKTGHLNYCPNCGAKME